MTAYKTPVSFPSLSDYESNVDPETSNILDKVGEGLTRKVRKGKGGNLYIIILLVLIIVLVITVLYYERIKAFVYGDSKDKILNASDEDVNLDNDIDYMSDDLDDSSEMLPHSDPVVNKQSIHMESKLKNRNVDFVPLDDIDVVANNDIDFVPLDEVLSVNG